MDEYIMGVANRTGYLTNVDSIDKVKIMKGYISSFTEQDTRTADNEVGINERYKNVDVSTNTAWRKSFAQPMVDADFKVLLDSVNLGTEPSHAMRNMQMLMKPPAPLQRITSGGGRKKRRGSKKRRSSKKRRGSKKRRSPSRKRRSRTGSNKRRGSKRRTASRRQRR